MREGSREILNVRLIREGCKEIEGGAVREREGERVDRDKMR